MRLVVERRPPPPRSQNEDSQLVEGRRGGLSSQNKIPSIFGRSKSRIFDDLPDRRDEGDGGGRGLADGERDPSVIGVASSAGGSHPITIEDEEEFHSPVEQEVILQAARTMSPAKKKPRIDVTAMKKETGMYTLVPAMEMDEEQTNEYDFLRWDQSEENEDFAYDLSGEYVDEPGAELVPTKDLYKMMGNEKEKFRLGMVDEVKKIEEMKVKEDMTQKVREVHEQGRESEEGTREAGLDAETITRSMWWMGCESEGVLLREL